MKQQKETTSEDWGFVVDIWYPIEVNAKQQKETTGFSLSICGNDKQHALHYEHTRSIPVSQNISVKFRDLLTLVHMIILVPT